MQIRNIRIVHWRHFKDIELNIEEPSPLVCVVGANGTGKSHLLELISTCAHELGLAHGIDIPRGNPFDDVHEFSLQFFLAVGVSEAVEGLSSQPEFTGWDRTITIESINSNGHRARTMTAGGIEGVHVQNVARAVVQALKSSADVHFLSLDADRSYPKKTINMHEVAQAYELDWSGHELTRGRSFKVTSTLYDEWLKYFLAQENQSGTRLITGIRRARQNGEAEPSFADHFQGYKDALSKVLPHIMFAGVDSKKRTLLFDTTGIELSYDQLSGGEREIGFLIGQIDRFGLKNGLLLIDEPELHLNPELIRTWVRYLTGTVQTGQVWLATHSLEAVEAVGQAHTFVLERDPTTRKVNSAARLDHRPLIAALSRTVGTPAFSVSQHSFVFVEGEEIIGERERFQRLTDSSLSVKFLEGGACSEVLRRVDTIRRLAAETITGIKIGGIIDRDFLTIKQVNDHVKNDGVYSLAVHEVENFFLHPASLNSVLFKLGKKHLNAETLIQTQADDRAGSWIFQHAMATNYAGKLPPVSPGFKEAVKSLTFERLQADRHGELAKVTKQMSVDATTQAKFAKILGISTDIYERKRKGADLWIHCEGKQVLNGIAAAMGLRSQRDLTDAIFAHWEESAANIPDELNSLRDYVSTL